MSARITNCIPPATAIASLRDELDDYMRIWHTTNIEKTKNYADGYTDAIAMAIGMLAGTTALDELLASQQRTNWGKK